MTTGHPPAKIDLADVLENSRIGPLQIRVFVLCMICLIMDGFDVQAMGYTAPVVAREWGIAPGALGTIFSAANFGVLLGSLLFSMVADKVGRRPVLIGATLFFSVMTVATAQAQTVSQLLWLRFISGIGLGCIMPNATALIGEFSPRSKRVTLMMCITVGFTAGGAVAGFIAAWLIPNFGWRSVFYFGGAIPLVVGVLMVAGLPESPQFLAVRRKHLDRLAGWLKQIDPRLQADASSEYVVHEENKSGVPVLHLFGEGRGLLTILLWVVNFMNLLNLYALSNWLATVVNGMGYTQRTAVLVSTVLQVGGTIGTFGLAWLIHRFGFMWMLTVTFAVATLSIASIGQPGISLTLLFVIVFIAGWCIIGGQPGLNALEATCYPTYLRSTGVGWALGIGRTGAIVGPYVGGMLLANKITTEQLFYAAAVPALISTVVMFAMRFVVRDALTERATVIAH